MKTGLATMMVTAIGLAALPVSAHAASDAKAPKSTPVAISTADLPLTPRFSSLLTSYRNCVLRQVDQGVKLGEQSAMAQQAMSACAISRGELRSQLISDIHAQNPAYSSVAARQAADAGIDQLDPMIEQAAVDWAHMRYARDMY